jgi:hypothetical protein
MAASSILPQFLGNHDAQVRPDGRCETMTSASLQVPLCSGIQMLRAGIKLQPHSGLASGSNAQPVLAPCRNPGDALRKTAA